MALIESSSVTAARRAPRTSASHGDVDRSVVWLRGEHDTSTVATLSATLRRAIAIDDADLVVDLSGVTFMGAETIGMIARARVFLCRRSRSLQLRCPSPYARRVLDICDIPLGADHISVGPAGRARSSAALGTWPR